MLCNNCGKREVEVMVRQVVSGEVRNLNLCRECAEEMGFISSEQAPSITISFSLGEPEPSRAVRRKRAGGKRRREEQENALVCETCGTVYKRFRETGLLGCPDCYGAFRSPLGAYLQEKQGAESHWGGMSGVFDDLGVAEGRLPEPDDPRAEELKRLAVSLDEAVALEDYERAAELRDAITRLRDDTEDDDL